METKVWRKDQLSSFYLTYMQDVKSFLSSQAFVYKTMNKYEASHRYQIAQTGENTKTKQAQTVFS